MSDKIVNLIHNARSKLDSDIKSLEAELKKNHDILSTNQKSFFAEAKKTWESLSNELNKAINDIITSRQDEMGLILQRLSESLQNQMGSFGDYATNILGEREQLLVNINETSLSNIKDITQSHIDMLSALILQISSIANDAVSKSIEISRKKEDAIRSEMKKTLSLQKEELEGSVKTLQDEFREKIATQIESVYMGVSKTKDGINEIIADTLSRLEENLHRLTEGLDENFASEVGETQNLIHRYEGKLLLAIEEIHRNYEKQTDQIIKRHTALAKKNLLNLENTLNKQKEMILSQINDLSTDQQKLVHSAINQLEGEMNESKSIIIEFMGDLKDQIQNAVSENRNSTSAQINELMDSLNKHGTESRNAVKDQNKEMQESLKENLDKWTKSFEENVKASKKGSEETTKQMRTSLNTFEQEVKQTERN